MKKIGILLLIFFTLSLSAQSQQDSIKKFKKRVLDNTEIDLLTSYYNQQGSNAAVTGGIGTGGIGTEELTDIANDINIAIPVNADDVLSIGLTISAYSSASSSNLNPFFSGASTDSVSGASTDDDDDYETSDQIYGSPWITSSGASKNDIWVNANFGYAHSSDSRNEIYSAHLSIANEYDYFSLGGGLAFTKLFNQKNTEIGIGTTIYLDQWRPEYPTEIKTYYETDGDLNADYFYGVDILDQNGNPTDKTGSYTWQPSSLGLIDDKGRNTYAVSLSFSQILTPSIQMALFTDVTYQEGWLANPMQRVYFADVDNFYIGNPDNIDNYTNPTNTDTFQLADDIERLPDNRLKIPIGTRLHFYINEYVVLRTYYRYYFDDWGIQSHTFNVELPIKISEKFTLYPSYRYYDQTAADYFAPYETHLSTQQFYTSDYDLSAFNANQYGLGIKYNDIFSKMKLFKFGIKSVHLDYNYYDRSTGLSANIVSLGIKLSGN